MIKIVKFEQRNKSDGEAKSPDEKHDDDGLMELKATHAQRKHNRHKSIQSDQCQCKHTEFGAECRKEAGKLTQS